MANLLRGITLQSPLPVVGRVTSFLGDLRPYGSHEGVDIAVPAGTNILSIAPGTVTESGYDADGYGYYVRINHGGGVESLYGHMRSAPVVARDAAVRAGELLGYVGSTGYSSGNHLHISVWVDGVAQTVDRLIDLGVQGVRQTVPCLEFIDNQSEWIECMGLDPNDPLSITEWEDAAIQAEIAPGGEGTNDTHIGLPDIDLQPLVDVIDEGIKTILTFPVRLWVNATDLSETSLTNGKETWDWITDGGHVGMFATSLAVTGVAFFLLLIAAWSLVAPSVGVAARAVTNPVGTVAEQAKKL